MKKLTDEYLECIQRLLDDFWVLRFENEELFFYIRQYEHELRTYFKDTFRFKLVVGSDFAKLEKFQLTPHPDMGIEVFKENKDYVFFFCLLAFLEGKTTQQFTISDVCEAIVSYFPERIGSDGLPETTLITWKEAEGYYNRLSLIRVLKEAERRHLIIVVDRELDGFRNSDSNDALLKSTGLGKYFIRNFGFDITKANSLDDVILMQTDQEKGLGIETKHKMYRRLFLEPVMYKDEAQGLEFDYLRTYGHHIGDHADKYYDMNFELYLNTAMLTRRTSRRNEFTFPADNAESNLVVQFASEVRSLYIDESINPPANGKISLSVALIEGIVRTLIEQKSSKWTATLKAQSVHELIMTITKFLFKWNLARPLDDGGLMLYDATVRFDEKITS
ncbi:TIGR02678 family protein [Paenibacillus sp. FSL E2-0201]|uniref:TIGR02678 family protein n=1 Tax=Paenibacillus sp. FSL E2-0201 TaxID=2954726 RepID=UPI0030DA9C05